MRVTIAKWVILALVGGLVGGCAGLQERVDQVKAMTQQAASDADAAREAASAASRAAEEARRAASVARRVAQSAQSAAGQANSCCVNNSEKLDRMFKESMRNGGDENGSHTENGNGTSDADKDTDSDGLTNGAEAGLGSDPDDADTDDDGLEDGLEVMMDLNPLSDDSDGDGTLDGDEDTDSDGIPNGVELAGGFDPNHPDDGAEDADNDGLSNVDELQVHGTNPNSADSDDDGLEDGVEIALGLDPNNTDSDADGTPDADTDADSDGLTNGAEVGIGSDPGDADTDDDGLEDGLEVTMGLKPLSKDSDGDGTLDGNEDTDGDGIPNGVELANGFDPNHPDDGAEDADNDGLSNVDELQVHRTDPNDTDTDDDGLEDGLEVTMGLKPLSKDSDGDGTLDGNEDTDGLEVAATGQITTITFAALGVFLVALIVIAAVLVARPTTFQYKVFNTALAAGVALVATATVRALGLVDFIGDKAGSLAGLATQGSTALLAFFAVYFKQPLQPSESMDAGTELQAGPEPDVAADRRPPPRTIFVSYRRSDSADVTGRIYEHLVSRYGEQAVFKDVEDITLGDDFRETLTEALRECRVVLAVIGPKWAGQEEGDESSRIGDAGDFVRVEVESALKHRLTLIPLLVQGAEIPSPEELPVQIKDLAYRNGMNVRPDPDFGNDMHRLIADIDKILARAGQI